MAAGLPIPSSPTSNKPSQAIIGMAVDGIIGGNLVVLEYGLSDAQRFQLQLQSAMNTILGRDDETERRHEMLIPSNIFGGITNNTVHGAWIHTRPNYWYQNNNKESPTFRQNSEFFANYFSASMLHNQAMLDNMRDFFPDASEILNDVTANITSRIGG